MFKESGTKHFREVCYFCNSKPCHANSNSGVDVAWLMWQNVVLQSRVQSYWDGGKVGSYHLFLGIQAWVTRLVGFWGCAQSNASRTCVCLKPAGCEGLHLFLGSAPQNGIWSGQRLQANASFLKPHLISHLWESFKSQFWGLSSSCSLQCICTHARGALQVWLCTQQLPPALQQQKCSCSFSLGALLTELWPVLTHTGVFHGMFD